MRRLLTQISPTILWSENQTYWFLTRQTHFSTHLSQKIVLEHVETNLTTQ